MTALGRTGLRWWAVVLVLAAWQAVTALGHFDPLILPAPATIGSQIVHHLGGYALPLLHTLGTAGIGLVAGVAVGYACAALTWLLPVVGATLTPLALILRSVPFVALIPVLTRTLGYTENTARIICALVCFFPTFVLVSSGLRDTPPDGAALFSIAGASRWARFRYLAMPSSIPALANSLRIAAASSVAAALIGEFLMGIPGLAFVLEEGLQSLNVTQVWAASACAGIAAVVIYLLATRLERYLVERWR
jgi:putative hydroxymethylpyrimidine transport system permease protein